MSVIGTILAWSSVGLSFVQSGLWMVATNREREQSTSPMGPKDTPPRPSEELPGVTLLRPCAGWQPGLVRACLLYTSDAADE